MKTKYAIASALLLSLSVFAQKDELKALKKIDEKTQPTPADLQEYKRLLTEVGPKMGAATAEQKADYYYYKGTFGLVELMMMPTKTQAKFDEVMADLNTLLEIEKSGKKKYTKEIQDEVFPEIKTAAATIGQQLGRDKKFKEAAPFFAAAYKVDPKDPSNLYNAAAMAVNGAEYNTALQYYLELDKLGYTGETTVLTARNKKTGEVEGFPNAETRKIAVQTGQYSDPKDEKMPSVRGEIVKNIALIYNQQGDTEKAKQAFVNARKANPDDVNLIISEADLYLKSDNTEMYKTLINEAVQKNPNDATLFYNLGVVTSTSNKAEAMKFYEKALQLKPDMTNANINMGVMVLDGEKAMVEEMNKLGTSAKEQKRYDELKAKRDSLYKKALPYFESAHKSEPENQYVMEVMVGVYQALEMDNEAKALKAKMNK